MRHKLCLVTDQASTRRTREPGSLWHFNHSMEITVKSHTKQLS